MIKTDKVKYHTKTQEEFDWLMGELRDARCKWGNAYLPTLPPETVCWENYLSNTSIYLKNKKITCSDFDFFKSEPEYDTYEFIEVSDIMKKEKETITDEPSEQDDKQQKIKKIIYNIEVYFE